MVQLVQTGTQYMSAAEPPWRPFIDQADYHRLCSQVSRAQPDLTARTQAVVQLQSYTTAQSWKPPTLVLLLPSLVLLSPR